MNDLSMNDQHNPPNRRVFILLLDSFGIGASLDAEKYGDKGSDTLGHIAEACAAGKADLILPADQANNSLQLQRQGTLQLPNLCKRGLAAAHLASTGAAAAGLQSPEDIHAKFGYAVEQSLGKDTPSGHWEIAGVPVMFEWGYFKPEYPSFPAELTDALIQQCDLPGVLGNKHASGTVILEELGAEHIASGKPIVYTSADSVFQIAAHEQHFGLDKLYEICQVARKLVDDYNIGRVIARPFIGELGSFKRTGNRRDYATPPPASTLLDCLQQAGREVISIGKIADIYAHSGLTQKIKASGNHALFDATLAAADTAPAGSLIFTNFVDFDSEYGHRRNVAGYAAALEYFDRRLPELEAKLQAGDMVVISADHGCDPTWPGTDHTREHIPVIAYGEQIAPGFVGRRDTFADIGQSIASYLGIEPLKYGVSFL